MVDYAWSQLDSSALTWCNCGTIKFNLSDIKFHPLLWFLLKAKSHEVYYFNYFKYSLFCHNKINNLFMKARLSCALHSSIITQTPRAWEYLKKNGSIWLFTRSKWCQPIFIQSEKPMISPSIRIKHRYSNTSLYYFARETHNILNNHLMDERWDCASFLPREKHLSQICRSITSFFTFISLSSVFFMLHEFWGRIRRSSEGSYLNRMTSSSCALGGTSW